MLALSQMAVSQTAPPISPAISTPNRVETRIGTLDFKDGAPSAATVAKIYDNLDFTHAFDAFNNTFRGVSVASLHKGLLNAGVKDNEVIVYSGLMDAKSLYLTANADTVYFVGVLDLTKGPMVLEVPPGGLGTIDDYWFRWVIEDARELLCFALELVRPIGAVVGDDEVAGGHGISLVSCSAVRQGCRIAGLDST